MRFKVECPTETEWVLADEQNMVHYYAVLYPALLNRSPASQLVISILGEYKDFYCIGTEVYSNLFFAEDPKDAAAHILTAFVSCRSQENPVELVYDYGGSIGHSLPAFYKVKENLQ